MSKPQVAARIGAEQERWLKDYFRTKSAGAEFILPWAVDTFFRAIMALKNTFAPAELKTSVEAYKDVRLTPESTRASYLALRLQDACEAGLHDKHGAGTDTLLAKIKRLDDTQATALMVWAAAFWVSRSCTAESLDEYIRTY